MTHPYRAQIYVRPHTPSSPSTKAIIVEYASVPIPPSLPPSPLSPLSSPLPMIPSPPLLLPPLQTSPTYTSASLAYIVAMVQSDIPKTNMPFQKRLCLTAPASRFEIGESSTAAATGQTGHTLARKDAHELYVRDKDAQDDRALLRAQISLLMRERSTALEASIRTLEALVRTLQTQHDRMEWQRQEACDMVTSAFGRIHALQARDTRRPYKMAPKKTSTLMIDATIKGLIAQGVADALAEYEVTRNSRNRDDSHDSGTGRRTERATRECTYTDFLKFQPLNFKGTKGVVGLTKLVEEIGICIPTISNLAPSRAKFKFALGIFLVVLVRGEFPRSRLLGQ
ncbi:hypothetical protein Tco_0854381 [Tanacetum coccineum]